MPAFEYKRILPLVFRRSKNSLPMNNSGHLILNEILPMTFPATSLNEIQFADEQFRPFESEQKIADDISGRQSRCITLKLTTLGSPLPLGVHYPRESVTLGSPLLLGVHYSWEPITLGSPLLLRIRYSWESVTLGSPFI